MVQPTLRCVLMHVRQKGECDLSDPRRPSGGMANLSPAAFQFRLRSEVTICRHASWSRWLVLPLQNAFSVVVFPSPVEDTPPGCAGEFAAGWVHTLYRAPQPECLSEQS